ncbi:MAG: hypothetical protein M0C28_01455 [Candidatus Moduliflexus flocculans]|nr:hypothetical protein [Candidatus Moduliflexus flocculans]
MLAVNKGLEALGGMKRFVKPGSTVGLLANAPAWWTKPGSHTHPDITLAVILAALAAGAKEVHYLIDPLPGYWKRSPLAAKYDAELGAVRKCSNDYVATTVAEEQVPEESQRRQGIPRLRRLRQPAHHQAPRRRGHVGEPQEPDGRQHRNFEPVLPRRLGREGRIRRRPLPGPVHRRPQHAAQTGPVRRRRHGVPADERAGRSGRDPQARQDRPGDRSGGRRRLLRALRRPQGGRRPDDHEVGRMGPRTDRRRQIGRRTADRLNFTLGRAFETSSRTSRMSRGVS